MKGLGDFLRMFQHYAKGGRSNVVAQFFSLEHYIYIYIFIREPLTICY